MKIEELSMQQILYDIHINDAHKLKEVLRQGLLAVNSKDDDERTILHYACKHGSVECVQVILGEVRVDVNARDKKLDTPLFIALKYNQVECAQALLAYKDCNVNAKNANGQTPLHYAIVNGKVEFVKLFMQHPNINLSVVDGNKKTIYDLANENTSEHKREIMELLGLKDHPDPVFRQPTMKAHRMNPTERTSNSSSQKGPIVVFDDGAEETTSAPPQTKQQDDESQKDDLHVASEQPTPLPQERGSTLFAPSNLRNNVTRELRNHPTKKRRLEVGPFLPSPKQE